MDIRQFLLDAPETCYITCYDLLLHTKDGSTHHLEDYNEISEVADITTGGSSLEIVPGITNISFFFCNNKAFLVALTWKVFWQHCTMIDL